MYAKKILKFWEKKSTNGANGLDISLLCDRDVLSEALTLIWIPKKAAVSSLALKQEVELKSSSPRLV